MGRESTVRASGLLIMGDKQHFGCGGSGANNPVGVTAISLGIAPDKASLTLYRGALKARRIDEGFNQQKGMAKCACQSPGPVRFRQSERVLDAQIRV